MTVPGTAAWLPNLRATILHDPDRAVTYLRRLTGARFSRIQPSHRIDAFGLLAETHLRQNQPHLAVDTATAAGQAAREMDPPDWHRLIVVQGITADIAVRTGHTDGVDAASDFHAFVATRAPDRTSTTRSRRQRWAAALLATAVYRIDAASGVQQLAIVRDTIRADDPDWEPGLRAVTAGLHAMHHRHILRAVTGPPPPMPGGYLHPDMDHPPDGYLPDRITAHQADPTSPAGGGPTTAVPVSLCVASPAGSRPHLIQGGPR